MTELLMLILTVVAVLLTWIATRKQVNPFLMHWGSRTRDAVLHALDRLTGQTRSVPAFGDPVSDAEVFVNWVGSRDSHVVYTKAREGEESRENWPQMQEHCGSPFWAKFERKNGTEEFCTLRFVDGSEAICHIATTSDDPVLQPVRIKGVDIDRADAVRKEMEANARRAAFAATIMESPGAHVNVGTGESRWVEPPKRLKSEGGKLKVGRSPVWDWQGAWLRKFTQLLRGKEWPS